VLGLERKQKNVEALQKDPTSIPDSTWKSHSVKVIKSYSKLINYLIINSMKILISSFFLNLFIFSATFESAEEKSTKLKDSLHLKLDTDTDKEQDSQNLNHLAESTSNIIVPTTLNTAIPSSVYLEEPLEGNGEQNSKN
jgi:hypothetical protein